MDAEVLDRLQKFHLAAEEEKGLWLEKSDIQQSKEESLRSLIGKIHGEKVANFTGLKNTLNSIWSISKPAKVRELGYNMFQFVFENKEDRDKVFQGRPWNFDGQCLVLKSWNEEMKIKEEDFTKQPMWVQVWNVPNHWISRETGFRIGKKFSEVFDVIIPENGSKFGRHLKIFANVNLDKPLLRGTMLRLEDQVVWIDFKYENLGNLCYYCGKVGHSEKNCQKRRNDVKVSSVSEGQYGESIKAYTGFTLSRKAMGSKEVSRRNYQEQEGIQTAPPVPNLQKLTELARVKLLENLENEVNAENDQMRKEGHEEGNNTVEDWLNKEGPSSKDEEQNSEQSKNENRLSTLRPLHREEGFLDGPSEVPEQKMEWESRTESMILIEVPVHMNSNKGASSDFQKKGCSNVGEELHAKEEKDRKKWKRLGGKENREGINIKGKAIRQNQEGSKRPWRLQDEKEKDESNVMPLKKQKGERQELGMINIEVVEASLKWPQTDK